MTAPAPTPGQDAEPRRYTAVEMRRAEQWLRRYSGCLPVTLFVGPILIFVIALLAMTVLGPVAGALFFMAAVALGFLAELFKNAMVLLIPSAILVGTVFAIRYQYRRRTGAIVARASADRPADHFATEIGRLNALRLDAAKEARRKVMIYVPIGVVLAIAFILMPGRGSGKSGPVAELLLIPFAIGFGITVPWLIALAAPEGRYAKAFKRALLPLLLKPHGELRYVEDARPALAPFVAKGLLPVHDTAVVDDAIAGRHAGYDLQLSEIRLERKAGKNDVAVFNGLLLVLSVDTPFLGTTLVLDRDRSGPSGLMPIRLEDPRFASIYAVYGNDQVEARAVLTPAVMERLLSMADGGDFFPPFCLVERDMVALAIGGTGTRELFEPPSLQANDVTDQLAHLEQELAMIFSLVDAAIAMHRAVRPGGAMSGEVSFLAPPSPGGAA